MLVNSSGNVGIGTTTPDKNLHIKNGDSGSSYSADGADLLIIENNDSVGIDLRSPAANSGNIFFSDASARSQGRVFYDHNNDSMSLCTNGVGNERMRIDASGNVGIGTSSPQTKLDVTGTSVIGRFKSTNNNYVLALQGNNASQQSFIGTTSSGDMVFATGSGVSERIRLREGGGLTFNGDTAADNALDDYEEGTWTGLLNGGNFTATQTNFVYTKIGRQVTVNGTLTAFSSSSNSSNIELTGLPFSTASGISFAGPAFFSKVNKYNNYGYPQACRVEEGSNRIIFMYNGEGANGQFPVRYGDLNNTSDSRIQFTATYFTT